MGYRLGAERDLMVRHGVSRSSFREAVRQLEAFGAVEMRRGGGGGLVVAEPPERLAARAVTTYLALVDIGWDELFEVRVVLEAFAAGLAASRASEAEVLRLRALTDGLEGDAPPAVVAAHVAMRDLIAEMSGNAAIALFVAAFNRLTFEAVGGLVGGDTFRERTQQAAEAKRRTVEAIVARDAPRAQAEARSELLQRRDALRPVREASRAAGVSPLDRAERSIRLEVGYVAKLSHRVAERIARQVMQIGPGVRLGAEPELAAKYGVSRAVFREAIHLMETHGLVVARRGQGGGVITAEPRPEQTVDIAARYLAQLQLSPLVTEEARSGIAIVAARLAAQRAPDVDKARLQDLLDRQLAAGGSAHTAAAYAVQQHIGGMGGNRAISLILQVLIATHWREPPRPLPEAAALQLNESHRQLVAAICGGDAALAEGRMVQHITRARRWTGDLLATPV